MAESHCNSVTFDHNVNLNCNDSKPMLNTKITINTKICKFSSQQFNVTYNNSKIFSVTITLIDQTNLRQISKQEQLRQSQQYSNHPPSQLVETATVGDESTYSNSSSNENNGMQYTQQQQQQQIPDTTKTNIDTIASPFQQQTIAAANYNLSSVSTQQVERETNCLIFFCFYIWFSIKKCIYKLQKLKALCNY